MRGTPADGDGHGLKNLRQRAERLGGGVDIGTSREGGTRITWHVPIDPAILAAGAATT